MTVRVRTRGLPDGPAHDDLNNLKLSAVDAFTHGGDAGYRVFDALDGFKNSMGALVAYLGNQTRRRTAAAGHAAHLGAGTSEPSVPFAARFSS